FHTMEKTDYTSGVLQYIPFLYVIWADDLISPSEISVTKRAIKEDSLSAKEKEQIEKWLDTTQPPSMEIINHWKNVIDQSGVKLIESDTYPLTEFSRRLAQAISPQGEPTKKESLEFIEINLGIQPNHYHHLFDVEVVQEKTARFY